MQRKPIVNSSNIVSAGFEDGIASVEFKSGAIYESKEVTPDEWQAFEKTFADKDTSTGSYYAKNLKGKNWKKQ